MVATAYPEVLHATSFRCPTEPILRFSQRPVPERTQTRKGVRTFPRSISGLTSGGYRRINRIVKDEQSSGVTVLNVVPLSTPSPCRTPDEPTAMCVKCTFALSPSFGLFPPDQTLCIFGLPGPTSVLRCLVSRATVESTWQSHDSSKICSELDGQNRTCKLLPPSPRHCLPQAHRAGPPHFILRARGGICKHTFHDDSHLTVYSN